MSKEISIEKAVIRLEGQIYEQQETLAHIHSKQDT